MTKDDWVKAALVLGGIALLAKLLKDSRENKNVIYRCGRCNYPLSKYAHCCPNCGTEQRWGGIQ